jgi:general secretion pathway protein I
MHRARGFTLLEVLVTFTIVALVLATALQIFSDGLRSTTLSERHVTATIMANAKLAEIDAQQPPLLGRLEGVTVDGFRWRTDVEEYAEPGAEDLINSPVILYRLDVIVGWGPVGRERLVQLATLRVGAAPEERQTQGTPQ